MLAIAGRRKDADQVGSPSLPGLRLRPAIFREDGTECGANEKGIVGDRAAAAAGLPVHRLGQDDRFVSTYFTCSRSRWFIPPTTGRSRTTTVTFTILGRTDDVINVAGHRLGTREIEEAIQNHPAIAEVAVVGVEDKLKGQVPMAFAVVKDAARSPRRNWSRRWRRKSWYGRRHFGRHCPSGPRALRDRPAQDAFRQDAAPFDPGAGRRPRSG
jgi:propionyl-CoA synthetase